MRLRLTIPSLTVSLVLALSAFLVLAPLVTLFYGSFTVSGEPGLRSYAETFSKASTWQDLWTTTWLAVVRAVLATALAVFLSWVVARTNTPYRNLIEFSIWLMFFIPPLTKVLAWLVLGMARSGLINVAARNLFHMDRPLIDIQSYGGIIWVSVLSFTPILYLLISPAFKGHDASLEEASRMAGASNRKTLFLVTVPLMMPAIMGTGMLAFVRMMESFETELFLGLPARIFVLSTRIFDYVHADPPFYSPAMALSSAFVLITFFLIAYQWRVLRRTERYAVVTGRGFSARTIDLGRWRYVTFGIALVYILLGTVVPLLALALGTLMKVPGLFNVSQPFTFDHYPQTLTDPYLLGSVKNTLVLAGTSATVGMVLYAGISYIITRTKYRARVALEFVTWLPYSVPSIVLALGFLWALVGVIQLPFFAYGTVQLLALVMLVRSFPLGVRLMNSTMIQLGKELEESSRILGGSWSYTFRRIVAPLLRPAFLAGWILVFVIAIRDLSTVILLYGPKSRVLSVLLMEYWGSGLQGGALVIALIMVVVTFGAVFLAQHFGSRRTVAG